jgi:hypothetical protein
MNTITTNSRISALARFKPKYAAVAVASALGVLLTVSDASAMSCVRGVYRAACTTRYGSFALGPNGAVGIGRYGNVYAYRRGSGCFWRNGQRICL